MKFLFSTLIISLFVFPSSGLSQKNITVEPAYKVNRVYPSISITKDELKHAITLCDFNRHYEPSWVREYISVEITTVINGNLRKATSKTDTLNQEQKEHLAMADYGSLISVVVEYIPENTLKFNDPKKIEFSFIPDPEQEANYAGGEDQLNQYLKKNAPDKIPAASFEGYKLAAVKFTINEIGQVTNPFIFWSSDDEFVDKILLETVCNMPLWIPAEYSNGTKVEQEFAFTVGNMESCVVNLLNIRPKF